MAIQPSSAGPPAATKTFTRRGPTKKPSALQGSAAPPPLPADDCIPWSNKSALSKFTGVGRLASISGGSSSSRGFTPSQLAAPLITPTRRPKAFQAPAEPPELGPDESWLTSASPCDTITEDYEVEVADLAPAVAPSEREVTVDICGSVFIQDAHPIFEECVAPLPIGWQEAIDSVSGRCYYVNRITGESTWIRPQARPLAGICDHRDVVMRVLSLGTPSTPRLPTATKARSQSRSSSSHCKSNQLPMLPASMHDSPEPLSKSELATRVQRGKMVSVDL